MKTIFLTIFQGVEAKNILRTPVLPALLRESDLRLVFFVHTPERAEYYRREFSDPHMIYEVADFDPAGLADRCFGLLKFQLLSTETTGLRRRMEFDQSRNWPKYLLGLAANRLLARPTVRRIARWLDLHFVRDRRFAPFFERYRPDAVFLAHLFDDAEISLLREAKRRSISTIGFVNSWDKLTARSAIRILPDRLLVYNGIVKVEAETHADMPFDAIAVVGIPQYDRYVGFRPSPREAFMHRIGLDPVKRFFLYAPMGEAFSNSDWDIIDLLHRWTTDGTLPSDFELFVRFQPNDFVNEVEITKRPWLRYDRPGTRFGRARGVDWDMGAEELRHLADTLSHASLLICYASSISVDAAVFGKPVININFDVRPSQHLAKSPTQFYHMAHYQNALQTGGIHLAGSPEDLQRWIIAYSEHPDLGAEDRQRLVREQCGSMDGRAGERIAAEIIAAVRP